MNLEEMRPAQIQDAADRGVPLLLPVGVLENHGWHLPCGVDLLVTRGISKKVAEQIEAVIAPSLSYGPGVNLVGRPEMGSLEVGYREYLPHAQSVLTGLVKMGFRKIFVICHHQGPGGQQGLSMQLAAAHLGAEEPRAVHPVWWGELPPDKQPKAPQIHVMGTPSGRFLDKQYYGGDHAGFVETCLILGLQPETADLEELNRGEPWFGQRDPHPSTCTAEYSQEFTDAWATALAEEIAIRAGVKTEEEVKAERDSRTA
ncbi:MAG: creatininase family protein [Planctomycetota bacterium]|jgi:creatinine amidohydrolase|nr:creatininase family protein [Planctomycetota bacterium]